MPPMATLEQYVVEACAKFRPTLDPARCRLHHNKAPVDLGTPLRLLNLPSGTKLEVVLGEARHCCCMHTTVWAAWFTGRLLPAQVHRGREHPAAPPPPLHPAAVCQARQLPHR